MAASDDEQLRATRIGPLEQLNGPIALAEYDPSWPGMFEQIRQRIRAALGDETLIEHVGSTSIAGLAAKPIIDVLVEVADSANEEAYVPVMEQQGFVLRVREPDWYQHRMFKADFTATHVHVFSRGCIEITRMLAFRDHLRRHPSDRKLYETAKRQLAQQIWQYMQQYADAKTDVIQDILSRSMA